VRRPSRSPTPAIELEAFEDLESRRELWTELASRSSNVFASWEWAAAWWRHFGARGRPAFVECRSQGDPFAILPLYVDARGPLRLLRLLGHGPGDVLGPVCDPADAAAAGRALRQALEAGLGAPWHWFLAERLPSGPPADAIGGRVLQREACPELEIGGRSWEEFLASSSRNLREKLRRNTRKLEQEHTVDFRLCEDAERLDADIDTLVRLHRSRWGEGSSFDRDRVLAFHRDFAGLALERGWLRLWTMTVDGEDAAAWYGFRFDGVEAFYQSGRDPRLDRFSVGFLMLMRTIRAAFDDGLERYSFLRGDEPYKDRLASRDDGLETQALGRGPLTSAGLALGARAMRSPRLRGLAARAMR
jgi:CelD/BcsL family acetyltransferase involved in cellulose biosynthesis